MKKSILLIILLIYSFTVFSQFLVFSNYLPYNQKTDVHPVTSNPEMGLPMIFLSGKEIRILYLADECKFQKEILIKRPTQNSKKYLGGYINDSSLILTFSDKQFSSISQIVVNLNTGISFELSKVINSGNQIYLTSWETISGLVVLGIVDDSNVITVSKLSGYGNVSSHKFNFDLNKIIQNYNSFALSGLFDSQGGMIQKVDASIPVSLYLASAKNKAYLINEEIIITIDYFAGTTYYLAINLLQRTHKILSYPCDIDNQGQLAFAKSNSFIYDNTLFQLSVDRDEVSLNISGLTDTNRKVKYYASKAEKIGFSNSSMEQRNEKEGFLYGNPNVTVIKKTKRFLKIVSKMKPAISVFAKQGDFQILLGGVAKIHQAAGVASKPILASGGEMTVGPGGNLIMPDPVYYFPTNYSFSSYSSRKSAYFSSIINSSSFQHMNKSISKYTYNYIVDYTNYMPDNQGLVTIFKMSGDYYLGYYLYGSNTYNLEWFKNIDDYSIQY